MHNNPCHLFIFLSLISLSASGYASVVEEICRRFRGAQMTVSEHNSSVLTIKFLLGWDDYLDNKIGHLELMVEVDQCKNNSHCLNICKVDLKKMHKNNESTKVIQNFDYSNGYQFELYPIFYGNPCTRIIVILPSPYNTIVKTTAPLVQSPSSDSKTFVVPLVVFLVLCVAVLSYGSVRCVLRADTTPSISRTCCKKCFTSSGQSWSTPILKQNVLVLSIDHDASARDNLEKICNALREKYYVTSVSDLNLAQNINDRLIRALHEFEAIVIILPHTTGSRADEITTRFLQFLNNNTFQLKSSIIGIHLSNGPDYTIGLEECKHLREKISKVVAVNLEDSELSFRLSHAL